MAPPQKKCGCPPPPVVYMPNRMEVTVCEKVVPPHPFDPKPPCDPCKEDEGLCSPAICLEKLKNPAYPGENSKCKPGEYIKIEACKRPEPPHPCDEKECIPGLRKKQKCPPAALCRHKIKNPMKKTPIMCPNDTYEAYEQKELACDPNPKKRGCQK